MRCEPEACAAPSDAADDPAYERVLWAVLAVNLAMFVVEAAAGLYGRSASLQADALDFLGDAATYGITLVVLGMGLRWRAGAALFKGVTMGLFGLWVLGYTAHTMLAGSLPSAPVIGTVGVLALGANLACAALLFRHRAGDANRRSVWLCTRNDAIANIAVIAAAGGVWASGSGWPDWIVGVGIACLALIASLQVLRQAAGELAVS
jgi:Co/Zn/Cd efflux system component